MIEDQIIYQQLERLAALYQWEGCSIWTKREPAGVFEFTATLEGNNKIGTHFTCATGESPAAAVEALIKIAGDRDPEQARRKRIRELELELARLKSMGPPMLPPYRAPNQVGYGVKAETTPEPPAVINVEARVETDDLPF